MLSLSLLNMDVVQPHRQTERQVWSYEKAMVSSVSSEKRLLDINKSGRVSKPIKSGSKSAEARMVLWVEGAYWAVWSDKEKFGVDTDMNTDGTSAITNISLH